MKMQQQSIPNSYPISTFFSQDFRVSRSPYREPDLGLKMFAEQCSSRLQELLPLKDLAFSSSKMFPDCLTMTKGKHLKLSSVRWTTWGIVYRGRFLKARISEFPSHGTGYILSDFLEKNVEEKYYLSRRQVEMLSDRESYSQGKRIYSADGVSCTLTSSGGGVGGKTGLYLIEGNGLPKIERVENGYRITSEEDDGKTESVESNGFHFVDMNADPKITEICRCITTKQHSGISKHKGEHSAVFVEGIFPLDKNNKEKFALIYFDENEEPHIGRIRRLTPRECWRLQGFRDEQIDKVLAKGISDHQMYRMAGNAVTVPVISAVAEIIKKVYQREFEENGRLQSEQDGD